MMNQERRENERWREQAACQGLPIEMFFPEDIVTQTIQDLCDKCPVQKQCLEYALSIPEYHGFWGGKSQRARRRIRKSRRTYGK